MKATLDEWKSNARTVFIGVATAGAMLGAATTAQADPITITTGTAVSSPDLTATFDSLTNGSLLTSYTEDGLSITVAGAFDYTAFDPTDGNGGFSGGFLYANSRNAPIAIATTNNQNISALSFNLGNGFFGLTNYFAYEVLDSSNAVISSGTLTSTPGGVVDFTDSDPAGFAILDIAVYDSVTVAAQELADNFAGPDDGNGGAIDNVAANVVTAAACGTDQNPCPAPEPWSISLFVPALAGLAFAMRKKAAPAPR
jgi:hypothetical protein